MNKGRGLESALDTLRGLSTARAFKQLGRWTSVFGALLAACAALDSDSTSRFTPSETGTPSDSSAQILPDTSDTPDTAPPQESTDSSISDTAPQTDTETSTSTPLPSGSLESADCRFFGDQAFGAAGWALAPINEQIAISIPEQGRIADATANGQVNIASTCSREEDTNLKASTTTLNGFDTEYELGRSLAPLDFNEDSEDDLAMGAPGALDELGIVYGATAPIPAGSFIVDDAATFTVYGDEIGSRFGTALTALNQPDDADDLAIVAPGAEEGMGSVTLYEGKDLENGAPILATIVGSKDMPIDSIASADFDGDGLPNLAIGASQNSGAIGFISPPFTDQPVEIAFVGEGLADELATQLTAIGDIDGDGKDDLALGAPNNTNGGGNSAGKTYVLCDPPLDETSGKVIDFYASISGEGPEDNLGEGALLGADLNNDGLQDLAMGVPNSHRAKGGAVFILPSPITSGDHTLEDASILTNDDPGAEAGFSLAVGTLSETSFFAIGAPGQKITWEEQGAIPIFELN